MASVVRREGSAPPATPPAHDGAQEPEAVRGNAMPQPIGPPGRGCASVDVPATLVAAYAMRDALAVKRCPTDSDGESIPSRVCRGGKSSMKGGDSRGGRLQQHAAARPSQVDLSSQPKERVRTFRLDPDRFDHEAIEGTLRLRRTDLSRATEQPHQCLWLINFARFVSIRQRALRLVSPPQYRLECVEHLLGSGSPESSSSTFTSSRAVSRDDRAASSPRFPIYTAVTASRKASSSANASAPDGNAPQAVASNRFRYTSRSGSAAPAGLIRRPRGTPCRRSRAARRSRERVRAPPPLE